MIMDKELYIFTNDVFDVLAGIKRDITQEGFVEKYETDEQCLETNCATNTISIGDFQIKISRKERVWKR